MGCIEVAPRPDKWRHSFQDAFVRNTSHARSAASDRAPRPTGTHRGITGHCGGSVAAPCLEVQEGNPAPGTPVQLGTCTGSDTQWWVYDRQSDTIYNPAFRRCLEVQEANPAPIPQCSSGSVIAVMRRSGPTIRKHMCSRARSAPCSISVGVSWRRGSRYRRLGDTKGRHSSGALTPCRESDSQRIAPARVHWRRARQPPWTPWATL